MPSTPFTDPDETAALYVSPDRLARRTGALHAAKTSGGDATTTITTLAAARSPARPVVCDIGCGRGTTTLALAARLRPRRLIAVDRSHALLETVAQRTADAGHRVETVTADFHHLPLASASVDVAVAAFCLYHSPKPDQVVADIARCLTPTGHAVLVTKSADSYHELDQLMYDTGLDTDATTRPSLYASFHSLNAPDLTATALRVVQVVHEPHVFRFADGDHLAAYLTTSPKYTQPQHHNGMGTPDDQLRRRLPDAPLTVTSTVTYITAGIR